MTKRGKQASRKAAARKYGFLEVPLKSSSVQIGASSKSSEAGKVIFLFMTFYFSHRNNKG
ncbi:MAG: hypothetical protein Q8L82_11670 [Nitrosomonas sp.]|nr:hypothetical protein [Nitrosomonas sp.]